MKDEVLSVPVIGRSIYSAIGIQRRYLFFSVFLPVYLLVWFVQADREPIPATVIWQVSYFFRYINNCFPCYLHIQAMYRNIQYFFHAAQLFSPLSLLIIILSKLNIRKATQLEFSFKCQGIWSLVYLLGVARLIVTETAVFSFVSILVCVSSQESMCLSVVGQSYKSIYFYSR